MFVDRSSGVAYRRFVQSGPRGPADLSDCVGGLTKLNHCPFFQVMVFKADDPDYFDGDCTGRM